MYILNGYAIDIIGSSAVGSSSKLFTNVSKSLGHLILNVELEQGKLSQDHIQYILVASCLMLYTKSN